MGRGNERAEGSGRSAHQRTRRGRFGRLLAGGAIVAVVSAGITVTAPDAAPPVTGVASARTYSADVRLAGVTLGVSGTFDGFSLAVPFFFYGTAIPQGDTFQPIWYPASLIPNIPIVSSLPVLSDLPYWPQSLTQSSGKGAAVVQQKLDAVPAGEKVTIIGLSQGAQVAEIVRASMANDPVYTANAENYEFVMLGNPTRPDGGILTRFTFLKDVAALDFLGIPFGRSGPADSPFKTTDITNQYDGFSDFPRYFNVLAIANAVVGMFVEHVLPGYVLDDPNAPNRVETTVGNTTYITLPKHLSLLFPLRAVTSVVGAEQFVDFMDPVLRVFVEMGYERTADPSKVAPFSFVTPQAKIDEAMAELPSAIAEGMAILGGKPYTPTVPKPVVSPEQAPDDAADAKHLAATLDDAAATNPAPAEAVEDTEGEQDEPKATETRKQWLKPRLLMPKADASELGSSGREESSVEGAAMDPSTDANGTAGTNESTDTRKTRSESPSAPDTSRSRHDKAPAKSSDDAPRTRKDRKASRSASDHSESGSSKESKTAA